MNNKLEKHHWIACSIFGITHGCNIIPVGHDLHVKIHKTMNYPYRTYTKMWRAFRIRHNHKGRYDHEMVRDILRMQQGYLDKWVNLPPIAQKMHFQKMNEMTLYYNPKHGYEKNWNYLWIKYSNAFTKYHLS